MKNLFQLLSANSLKQAPFHIKLDGTVGTIKLRKPSIVTRIANLMRSIITLIAAPIP